MQNQTYQSDYIPSVWYTKYRKPPGSHPTRTETTNEKLPSSDNGVSWVIVAGVLLVVTLTTAALAVAVFFSLRGKFVRSEYLGWIHLCLTHFSSNFNQKL